MRPRGVGVGRWGLGVGGGGEKIMTILKQEASSVNVSTLIPVYFLVVDTNVVNNVCGINVSPRSE